MAAITFLSDFGVEDYYVSAVKARILSIDADIQIFDISHAIQPHDIGRAAFLLRAVFRDFPLGTVHMVAVENEQKLVRPLVAFALEGHYFVMRDNGMCSLISDQQPQEVIKLAEENNSSFPTKDYLVPAAVALALGQDLSSLGGESYDNLLRLMNRNVKATKKVMSGHVIQIDRYGNLITNLQQTVFDEILHLNGGGKFSVLVGSEKFYAIQKYYQDVDSGDLFVLFNSLGYLEIGINKGNGAQLLGLKMDSPVTIEFETNEIL